MIDKLRIKAWPEWWLRIVTDVIAEATARGWDPPVWFKGVYNNTLFPFGMRMSPSRHTLRRWERLRNEKHE